MTSVPPGLSNEQRNALAARLIPVTWKLCSATTKSNGRHLIGVRVDSHPLDAKCLALLRRLLVRTRGVRPEVSRGRARNGAPALARQIAG